AGPGGEGAGQVVRMHLESDSKAFWKRMGRGTTTVEDLLARPDRSLIGVEFKFPKWERGKNGEPRRVEGNGWGGARNQAAASVPTVEGTPQTNEDGNGPCLSAENVYGVEGVSVEDPTQPHGTHSSPQTGGYSEGPNSLDAGSVTRKRRWPRGTCVRSACRGAMQLESWKRSWACLGLLWLCNVCSAKEEFWSSSRVRDDLPPSKRGPRSPPLMGKMIGAFALAGIGYQQMWEWPVPSSLLSHIPIPPCMTTTESMLHISDPQGLGQAALDISQVTISPIHHSSYTCSRVTLSVCLSRTNTVHVSMPFFSQVVEANDATRSPMARS
ncbi:unnamed protein product, partial [Closterium sp. Yama58-4]